MQAIIRNPRTRPVLVLLLVVGAALLWTLERLVQKRLEDRQDEAIIEAATRYGVHAALVKAVVWRESRFKPRARGRAGEIGLMQIRRDAAHEWAEAEKLAEFDHVQLLDPRKNTLAGTWYLSKLLRRYAHADNPVPYALADYNAGRSNVLKWNKRAASTNSVRFIAQIGFPATRAYVKSVMERFEHYRPHFPAKKAGRVQPGRFRPPPLPASAGDYARAPSAPSTFLQVFYFASERISDLRTWWIVGCY